MSDLKKEVENLEEVNVAAKDGAPAEASNLKNDAVDMGAPVVKPTDKNPDAASKAKQNTSDPAKKSANDGSLPNDQKSASMKEEETEVEGEEIAETTDSELEIDLSADVKALVSSDADLSEEFKDKAAMIFETAVKTRIQEQTKILEARYEEKLSVETETVKEAMVEKVDSYLNYVVEEWMKENELAVERGIRTEIAEDFITGLKDLFKEHYIDVPEEKYNVLDDLTTQTKKLEEKLNNEISKNVDLTKQVSESAKAKAIDEVSTDLADTEKEKFEKMAENVEYDSADKFREKLETIKESYFPKSKIDEATSKDEVDSVAANAPSDFTSGKSDAMAAYTAAITKNIKSVKI
ncbi:hypothetical protein N9R51_00380 [Candidatus Pelagibacter sp.]|nr:hypothetical protein [Candidatus Pelagibacter sp.]